jgi:hypothetical protein
MVDQLETEARPRGNGGLEIYVPQRLRVDSKNPIHPGDKIRITVDGEKMTIEPI